MAKGYNATEYMYSSARIRALETKMATREDILRFCDMDNSGAIVQMLSEYGFDNEDSALSREDMLTGVLERGFEDVLSMECAYAVKFLQYQYDCNNIKAILKCNARGISYVDMLLPLGSVSIDKAIEAFENRDYSAYPSAMAEAIVSAQEAFVATANPQKIDFIIDRACFCDMLAAANDCGINLAKRLAEAKIDLVNIMQTVRLLRMKLGEQSSALLDEAYIEGGTLDKDCLLNAFSDMDGFLSEIIRSKYYSLAQMISDGDELGQIEKTVDNIYLDIAKEAKTVPFGAEVAIGYIFALEYEIKNIRIILASKDAGLPTEVIRERLRDCYV